MNWRAIWAIVRKDITVVLRHQAVLLPLVIVPLILQVIMPVAFGLVAAYAPLSESDVNELGPMLTAMPPSLQSEFVGLDVRQTFFVLMLVYLFAPMYLIVPLMVASVIAADSFAGEKERKTLEALLHSPVTAREMLAGKILSALIPAVAVSLLSFIMYGIIVNVVGWPLIGRWFFPNVMWLILVLWVAPAVSCMGLGFTVLVSTRVSTFQEAYQMGGIVVLPVVALVIGQVSGLIFLSPLFTFILGLAIWLVDAAVLYFGARLFRREKLLSQL